MPKVGILTALGGVYTVYTVCTVGTSRIRYIQYVQWVPRGLDWINAAVIYGVSETLSEKRERKYKQEGDLYWTPKYANTIEKIEENSQHRS